MTSGHGSDGKRFWIATKHGERIHGRRVAWDEIPKFTVAPKIFGGACLGIAAWIASGLLADSGPHDFVGQIYPPVILVGAALAIALWAHEGAPVWRELAFGTGLLRLSSFAAHGLQWSMASRYDAVGVALVLVPLAWYLIWGIRRAVWEPLLSALLLAFPVMFLACFRDSLWETVALLTVFGLFSTVILAFALKFEREEHDRGMMQVD
jgi:hypothetical protein